MFRASPLLGIVATGYDLHGDLDASAHHIPGTWVFAVACAHTGRAEGALGEYGHGMHGRAGGGGLYMVGSREAQLRLWSVEL